jgi:hypothetical protein
MYAPAPEAPTPHVARAPRDSATPYTAQLSCCILGFIAGLSPLSLHFVGLRGDPMISDVLANADW